MNCSLVKVLDREDGLNLGLFYFSYGPAKENGRFGPVGTLTRAEAKVFE